MHDRLKRVFDVSGALMATFEALFSNPNALRSGDGFWESFGLYQGPEPRTGTLLSVEERGDVSALEEAFARLRGMSPEEMKTYAGAFLLRP